MTPPTSDDSSDLRLSLAASFAIDRTSDRPIREQLVEQLIEKIRRRMQVGDALPSSRALADAIGVARSTVVSCYLELEGQGWVDPVPGAWTFVSRRTELPERASVGRASPLDSRPAVRYDLRTGRSDPSLLTSRAWRSAWREDAASDYPSPPAGDPPLLAELAAYLRSARAIPCAAEDLVVCTGVSEAMILLALGLGWVCRPVAVEDPSYQRVPRTLARLGVDVRPLPAADPDRFLDALAEMSSPPVAVYLTPNHQYPLGHRLDLTQRHRLLAWAQDSGSVIVEDDYDSEFRFGVPPLDTLSSLAPDADVAYFGTFSKVLDPGLRLAYLRLPPRLRASVREAREDLGSGCARPVQRVVSRLLRSGELTRHAARMRRIYGDRRNALLSCLTALPAVRAMGSTEAGLHLVAELVPTVGARAVVREAAARGVALSSLENYLATDTAPDAAADSHVLVAGFAHLNPSALRRAVDIMAGCPSLR